MSKLFNKLLDARTDLQLTKRVEIKDVKYYLQEEYERAKVREEYIDELEKKIDDCRQLQLKYDALLIVQENTTERVKRREEKIEELKGKLKKEQKKNTELKAKITDIRTNAKRLVAGSKAKNTSKRSKK